MFKLFGKKEEERERPVSTASRHPEAAALSAQFGREEFDILAVTGANSFGGEREPEAEYWTATLPITAWREDDGPIHQEETCLVALADDKVLAYLRRVAPRDSIIQARVRQSLVDDRFLLVGRPTPMMDRELKAILENFFGNYTVAEAMEMMQKESIPCGPLCTVDEACQNPSILQREMLVEIDQPGACKLKITGNPIKLSQTPPDPCHPAPLLGQDTREVLRDTFGFSDTQISKWKEENIV